MSEETRRLCRADQRAECRQVDALNALVGAVSSSHKVQTTRMPVRGLMAGKTQIVLSIRRAFCAEAPP
jgi:hypothetical protein